MNSLLLALVIPALPNVEPPYPETSTNIPVTVNVERLDVVTFSMDLSPALSNEVVVAIGNDADGNGDLSFDEAKIIFGCDNGGRYFADLQTGEVATGVPSSIAFKRSAWKSDWNLAKVIKRGVGEVCETIESTVQNKKFEIRLR